MSQEQQKKKRSLQYSNGLILFAAFLSMFIILSSTVTEAHYPEGVTYYIFQFPNDLIPTLDGDFTDWEFVPEKYIIDQTHLSDTVRGNLNNIDPDDLGVRIAVGWNDSTNMIYFMVQVKDDFVSYRRTDPNALQGTDIFEIVVDSDNSGGAYHTIPGLNEIENQKLFSTFAQNYHGFLVPWEGIWAWYWGSATWAAKKPWSDFGVRYDGPHGSSGTVYLEIALTAFGYASYEGPESSAVHTLIEGERVGLSWSFLDYDSDEKNWYDGFYNLSHATRMDRTADLLPDFILMPKEAFLDSMPRSEFYAVPPKAATPKTIQFLSRSKGEITSYAWDFGDGEKSAEENPNHIYKDAGRFTVQLRVNGPGGTHRKIKGNYVKTY